MNIAFFDKKFKKEGNFIPSVLKPNYEEITPYALIISLIDAFTWL